MLMVVAVRPGREAGIADRIYRGGAALGPARPRPKGLRRQFRWRIAALPFRRTSPRSWAHGGGGSA